MGRRYRRTTALTLVALLFIAGFGGGAAFGRRSKNNPFIAKALGRITLETRGPSATGFGLTDVAKPLSGAADAVCIATSRQVDVAVATPEVNADIVPPTSVAVPPPTGVCAEGYDVLVRLQSGGGTFYFVAY